MLRLASLAALASAGPLKLSKVANPSHMQWDVTDGGLVQLRDKPDVHLNVAGATISEGSEVVLWQSQVHSHEQFQVVGTQIKVAGNEGLCLNVEGGAGVGHRVITFHCGNETHISPNEEFVFENGFIKMKHHPDLCLNVKGGDISDGGEIILYQCQEGNDNELFQVEGSEIQLVKQPEFHFNVAGADISNIGHALVLYRCHPAAHELFEFQPDGRIHLKSNPIYCLNAERGLGVGHKIVLWPCHVDESVPQELWSYNAKTGAIFATVNPKLGFNAAGGGLGNGDGIVVWEYPESTEL